MIYVANSTRQNQRIWFRLPEHSRTFVVEIPSGQQRYLGNDWNSAQLESFVQYLGTLGAIDAKTLSRKTSGFQGLIYSTEKALTENQILYGHEADLETREKRAADEATKAALAADQGVRNLFKGKRAAKELTVEVVQDTPKGERAPSDRVEMSVTVTPDGKPLKKR